MRTEEINIRDPYVITYEGKYYLYGTRSATCWGEADGFDCYVSADRKEWEGPIEVFHRPEGFFADRNYWAPECVRYQGAFYLIVTLGGSDRKKGTYILKSEHPEGPFYVYSGRVTPEDWTCIDATLYVENGVPYIIFSHSFEDTPDGDMCMLQLTEDLKQAVGEPEKLFSAVEAPWAKPIPFAKAEFGIDGDVYFTDGPCLVKGTDGRLFMTWSSWGERGYAVGVAVSESGSVAGPWKQLERPLYPQDGGHGMVFLDFDGGMKFTLHTPDTKYEEHPVFWELVFTEDGLELA